MTDDWIVEFLAFAGALLVALSPMFKLNTSITELTEAVRSLKENLKEKTESLDDRVTVHGKQIDDLKVVQAQHETRIERLEK